MEGPDLIPFRTWCRENGIALSTAYRMISDGRMKLKVTHVGKRTYLTRQDREAFLQSLVQAA